MDNEIKPIDSNNTDYYQWGRNCKLLGFDIGLTDRIFYAYEESGYPKESPEDYDLFWEGYHSVENKK